ncbi:MAG: hypothetical protein WC961_08125, partial [Anaerovoracaceae bacterium]
VEFKLNTNSPKEGIALIDEDSSTEIELLKADLVVTKGDVDVDKLVFDLTASTDLTDVQAVKLYDGTTVIGNVEATEAAVVFSDLDLNIKSGTTKTLTLKAEIAANTATSVTTVSLSAKIDGGNTAKTDIIGVNDKDASVTGVASGDTIFFYLVAPEISDIKASITEGKRDDGTTAFADARIEFVLTAKGGNVVLPQATSVGTDGGILFTSDASITAPKITVGGTSIEDGNITITNGQSKTVVVEGRLSYSAASGDLRADLKVSGIDWTGDKYDNTRAKEILKNLKTNSVVLTKQS